MSKVTQKTKPGSDNMTYHFNIAEFGMHGHLFKITNIDLTKEIKKIKDNPGQVRDVQQYPVDYYSMLIVISYHKKPTEIYFFKSMSYGSKKYAEIRKAIGIRI